MSSRPKADTTFFTSAFTESGLVISVETARDLYLLFVSVSAIACEAEAFRSTTATAAPASARVLQNSAPSNPAPPVTTATRPRRSNLSWIVMVSFRASWYRSNRPPIYVPDINLRLTKLRLPVTPHRHQKWQALHCHW